MLRLVIRSRVGNTVLAILGVIYFVSATATFVYYVATNWGANGLTDYALQAALIAAAIGGVFFVRVAADNLKLQRPGSAEQSRSSRDHRTAAAGAS
jgi:Na+/melibiose symporter-like transporter